MARLTGQGRRAFGVPGYGLGAYLTLLFSTCTVWGAAPTRAEAQKEREKQEEDVLQRGVCLDEEVKADLDAKRRRRSVAQRLVQKTNRHELSVRGGHFVSDLFESSFVVGGAYTYYLTESFAVEASGAYTRFVSAAAAELERNFDVLGGQAQDALFLATNLVFTPLHAKLQAGSARMHFDVSFTAGAGVVDSSLSRGVAGNAGIGFAFILGRAAVFRIDVRDYIYRQQLLMSQLLVNDLSVTMGLGILLPFTE